MYLYVQVDSALFPVGYQGVKQLQYLQGFAMIGLRENGNVAIGGGFDELFESLRAVYVRAFNVDLNKCAFF